MKWIIKYYAILFYGYLLRLLFSIFPLKKNTILFTSFDGEKVACNPFYIYKYIVSASHEFDIYWVVMDKVDTSILEDCKYVIRGSFRYYYLMHTAKFIITNDRINSYFQFRREQVLINTWHGGGAFKRTFGHPFGFLKWFIKKTNNRDAERTSFFVSSSNKWTDVIARNSFNFKGEVLPYGYPRNDIFFKENKDIIKTVKKDIGIQENIKVVLYAPTYRPYTATDYEGLNIEWLKNAIEDKTGKQCVVLFRGHHLMKRPIKGDCINVSSYPDMQELLLIADIMISDYSSCLWDYSLTYRPCFIFAPDFDKYLMEPGFESDYHEWPFPICKNNKDLIHSIITHNNDLYSRRVDKYLGSYGSYEKGKASEQLVEKLRSLMSRG